MIPAPRFDYEAAATPGGIYQGLGALANAATTAIAVNRKAKQDKELADREMAKNEQAHELGLARIAAEKEYRAAMLGKQDAALQAANTRHAADIEQRKYEARLKTAGEWGKTTVNGLKALKGMFVGEQHPDRIALANLRNAQTAKLEKDAPPPATLDQKLRMEELAMKQAQAEFERQEEELRNARMGYVKEVDEEHWYGDAHKPFERSDARAKIVAGHKTMDDILAEKRKALSEQYGLSGLQQAAPAPVATPPAPAPSTVDIAAARAKYGDAVAHLSDAELEQKLRQFAATGGK